MTSTPMRTKVTRGLRPMATTCHHGAVDEQVGETRRQNRRLPLLAVVIGLKIDRAFVDVLKQRQRRRAEQLARPAGAVAEPEPQ